jgi:hypothetical protein
LRRHDYAINVNWSGNINRVVVWKVQRPISIKFVCFLNERCAPIPTNVGDAAKWVRHCNRGITVFTHQSCNPGGGFDVFSGGPVFAVRFVASLVKRFLILCFDVA